MQLVRQVDKGKDKRTVVAIAELQKRKQDRVRKTYLDPEKRLSEAEADIQRLVDLFIDQAAVVQKLEDRLWKVLRLLR